MQGIHIRSRWKRGAPLRQLDIVRRLYDLPGAGVRGVAPDSAAQRWAITRTGLERVVEGHEIDNQQLSGQANLPRPLTRRGSGLGEIQHQAWRGTRVALSVEGDGQDLRAAGKAGIEIVAIADRNDLHAH